MATTWQPATREIDPFLAFVIDIARYKIVPVAIDAGKLRAFPDWIEGELPNGETVRVALTAMPQAEVTENQRAGLQYGLEGHATRGANGFRVVGEAILDVATKAFLRCDCKLEPAGQHR